MFIINKSEIKSIEVYADGGCRGNGSESAKAYGSFAVLVNGQFAHTETNEYVEGRQTNNVAEWKALIDALRYMAQPERVSLPFTLYMDSQLVVSQFTGAFKTKDDGLKILCSAAKRIAVALSFTLIHVDRSKIVEILGH